MSHLVGHREGTEYGWSWLVIEEGSPPPPKRSAGWVWTVGLGTVAVLASLVLVSAAASNGGGKADAERGEQRSGSLSAGGATQFRLAQWADVRDRWQFGDLNRNNSAYHEGEAVPFMLRVDNAQPGAAYELSIRYDCLHRGINAYDYLSDYDRDRGDAPALAPDGPGSSLPNDSASIPDASASIPDDPSISFDDGESGRRVQAWGASFLSPLVDPQPSALCIAQQGQKAEKSLELQFRALTDTVFILWGGHLSSRLDWGDGKGAASISGAPFHMKLDVPGPGVGERDRSIHLVLPPIIPTPTPTPTPAPSPTVTPSPTATPIPTPAPTATPMPTSEPAPTATPTPKATLAPTPSPTPTPKGTATPSPTLAPTSTPVVTASPTATPTATPSPTPPALGAAQLPEAGGDAGGPMWNVKGGPQLAVTAAAVVAVAIGLATGAWYARRRWLR